MHSVPIPVALVGCGAMTRDFHLPVLVGHDSFRVVALVDRELSRARALARDYQIPSVHADFGELDRSQVEGIFIVTPPAHHAQAAIALAQRGFHLLVEKPLAVSATDARNMVEAARSAQVVLSVGHHRRLYPCIRLLRALLAEKTYGRPLSFVIEEGGAYTWQLAALGSLRRDQAGGGVLTDIGCHVLDQLLFCLPGQPRILHYHDSNLGGIETDCLVQLCIQQDDHVIEGTIDLSRTRNLGGRIRVECEKASLEVRGGDRYRVHIEQPGCSFRDPWTKQPTASRFEVSWEGMAEEPGRAIYRLEYEDWLNAIRGGTTPLLDASTAIPVVELIEECYRSAQRRVEPWVQVGLPPLDGQSSPVPVGSTRRRRVLLTGATGFIGCRAAELLHLGYGWDVRALIHNPGSAARLARLPIEMIQGDLADMDSLRRALDGCDAVVHCAVGPSWKPRREVFAANALGTRQLARAALSAGVQRFVHLSTIAVYGNDVPEVVDETTPTRPDPSSSYATSKLAAETYLLQEVARGLPAVILRPAHVYGPFGKTFVTNPVQHLARGRLVVVAGDSTPSNTIHVDNVVAAIVCALEAPESKIKGQVFTLGAEDAQTWREFYEFFARMLDSPLRLWTLEEWQKNQPRKQWDILAIPKALWRGAKEILGSAELRSFLRRCVNTDPYGTLPRWLLERVPALRKLAGLDTPLVYRPAAIASEERDLVMKFLPGRVSIERAREVLGYQPALPREQAMALTWEWLRESRLIARSVR